MKQIAERKVFYRLIAFVLIIIINNSGYSSWKKIAQFPVTANCSFFLNEQYGFVGLDGHNGIMRTTDGGATWTQASTPNPALYYGFITDIFMKDSLRGWATIENDNLSHGLWFTTDGGVSWNELSTVTGEAACVYETTSSLIYTSRFSRGGLNDSLNGSNSFTVIDSNRDLGIDFVDENHGIVSSFQKNSSNINYTYVPILRTSDGGITWSQVQDVLTEAWSVYGEKGTPNFFIAGEKSQVDPDPTEKVYASTNYGISWQNVGILSGRTTGHIAGSGKTIYVQSETPWVNAGNLSSFLGLNRSTDGGKAWVNVGGPSNYRDTRFSVAGCNGNVVYAFDESGGVWKTTDGGDGVLGQKSLVISLLQPTLVAALCSRDTASITYSNPTCMPLSMTLIGFADSSALAIKSGALELKQYPKLPFTLNTGAIDSITLIWDPKKLGAVLPPSKVLIKFIGMNSGVIFDSLIEVDLRSLPPEPESFPHNIDFGIVKADSQICQTIVLRNTGTVESQAFILESASLKAATAAYSLLLPKLPLSVPLNDSVSFQVCFVSPDSLLHSDTVEITTDCFSFPIALSGKAIPVKSEVEPQSPSAIFQLCPNPVQDELSIYYRSDKGNAIHIELFNALGKKIISEERNIEMGMNIFRIEIKNLAQGIYMIKIGVSVRNFVKE